MPVATLDQTLPMFPNDNSLSADYFEHLMGWLVRTEQVPITPSLAECMLMTTLST